MQKGHYLYYDLEDQDDLVPFAVETFRIKGSFRENLELWNFPLDYQELTIALMSDWTSEMVGFEKDMTKEDAIRTETFTADQEWFLCRHVVTEAASTVKTEGSSAKNYPPYHIKCHVRRQSGYYLWNIATIIFLIKILSFCSFSVDITSPADQLSVTLTLLLTAVAFKIVLSESLPTISYLTLLDKYILSALVFLSSMAAENAVAAAIPDPDAQKLFEQICLGVGVICFLCIHIVALILVVKKERQRLIKPHREKRQERRRQRLEQERNQVRLNLEQARNQAAVQDGINVYFDDT